MHDGMCDLQGLLVIDNVKVSKELTLKEKKNSSLFFFFLGIIFLISFLFCVEMCYKTEKGI